MNKKKIYVDSSIDNVDEDIVTNKNNVNHSNKNVNGNNKSNDTIDPNIFDNVGIRDNISNDTTANEDNEFSSVTYDEEMLLQIS